MVGQVVSAIYLDTKAIKLETVIAFYKRVLDKKKLQTIISFSVQKAHLSLLANFFFNQIVF
jgi:hypothetical protein